MGVFGAISYLPLYLQGVIGMTASRAGLVILILSMGWTAGSLIAGQVDQPIRLSLRRRDRQCFSGDRLRLFVAAA